MNIDNKTILITGLVIVAGISILLGYENVVLTIAGGLLGYLTKDMMDHQNTLVDENDQQ